MSETQNTAIPTVDEIFEAAKRDLREWGIAPAPLAQLHDVCDANLLGHDERMDDLIGTPTWDKYMANHAAAHERLAEWLGAVSG